MYLPNRGNAFIPSAKLENYLLSTSHSMGKSKARFFISFGYDKSNADVLATDLMFIAQTEEVISVTSSPHGSKYIIDGSLSTPNGKVMNIRTIWIIEVYEDRPRLVTAYPRPIGSS